MRIACGMSLLFVLISATVADVLPSAKPLIGGRYQFQGNASSISQIIVRLKVGTEKNPKVVMQIAWVPGVELEMEGIAKLNTEGWTMEFDDDNFGNTGVIKLVQESTKTIKAVVIAKKKIEGRALRQYGDYRLIAEK